LGLGRESPHRSKPNSSPSHLKSRTPETCQPDWSIIIFNLENLDVNGIKFIFSVCFDVKYFLKNNFLIFQFFDWLKFAARVYRGRQPSLILCTNQTSKKYFQLKSFYWKIISFKIFFNRKHYTLKQTEPLCMKINSFSKEKVFGDENILRRNKLVKQN
jgi:hypothetical protein